LHPLADALEDAGWDMHFEEGHTAGMTHLVAEVSAQGGAAGGAKDEQEPAFVLRRKHNQHDVGDAGQGKRYEGAVDDGDQENAEQSETEEEMKKRIPDNAMC
jgi:hypothetical protein